MLFYFNTKHCSFCCSRIQNFVLFTLIVLIIVQYYQLWFAFLTVPVDFPSTARRWDCLESSKGGKVAWENKETHR
jgi:hypothetical protein